MKSLSIAFSTYGFLLNGRWIEEGPVAPVRSPYNGEYLPLDASETAKGRWGVVRRFPLGPISAITPFNFPLNLVAHKIAPAIAAGCSIVLKPAPKTPVCALLLARLVQEAGWPAGALSVLPLSNEDAAPLIEDHHIKMFTFTGSGAAGWELKKKAGKKRV